MYTTSTLGVVEASHVAEILREAGDRVSTPWLSASFLPQSEDIQQGLHVRDIAARTGVNGSRLCTAALHLAFAAF